MRVKIKHSFASYKENGETVCDLDELAKVLMNWGDIPDRLNDTRAMELALLGQKYLDSVPRFKYVPKRKASR